MATSLKDNKVIRVQNQDWATRVPSVVLRAWVDKAREPAVLKAASNQVRAEADLIQVHLPVWKVAIKAVVAALALVTQAVAAAKEAILLAADKAECNHSCNVLKARTWN